MVQLLVLWLRLATCKVWMFRGQVNVTIDRPLYMSSNRVLEDHSQQITSEVHSRGTKSVNPSCNRHACRSATFSTSIIVHHRF